MAVPPRATFPSSPTTPPATHVERRMSELRIKCVTVFSDRAEVIREIREKVGPGVSHFLVTNVSGSIESTSLKVDSVEPVKVQEFKFLEKIMVKEKMQVLEEERNKLKKAKSRANKQLAIVDGVAGQVSSNLSNLFKNATSFKEKRSWCTCTEEKVAGLHSLTCDIENFLKFYDVKTGQIDEEISQFDKNIKKLSEEMKIFTKEPNSYLNTAPQDVPAKILIILKAADFTDATITVRYIVKDASWEPQYEMKLRRGTKSMKVLYYAFVSQSTEEDWNDANLVLSSRLAQMNDQNIPEETTLNVGIDRRKGTVGRPPSVVFQEQTAPVESSQSLKKPKPMFQEMTQSCYISQVFSPSDDQQSVFSERAGKKVKGSSGPFYIAAKTSIKADGSKHKIVITTLEMPALFEYETIPSKRKVAYFKVQIINKSLFLLLAGQAAIFLDDAFLSDSRIEDVDFDDAFYFLLGVDKSIRVQYTPTRPIRATRGYFVRMTTVTHSRHIYLKNCTEKPIEITVIEPLPKSSDQKITVFLQAPILGTGQNEPVILNDNNNVEWKVRLGTAHGRSLILTYDIEYPSCEKLKFWEE